MLRIAPRRLRARPHGRQHRRPRDARLPDAAVHLVAEPVSRVAASRTARSPPEGVSGRDVEFIVYGWSRAPIFESGTRVWTLPDPVFQRLVESREPFWATLDRDDQTFRVYFLSDRGGIYALGYPVISWVGHLINLAELVMLAVVLYVDAARRRSRCSARSACERPTSGRALLREVRSSFYRKLFLAFWAGAVVPVFILAIFTRTYVATQLRRRRRGGRGRAP